MSLNFLSGLLNPTDPSRLHAELWGDYVSKVISCYLPILMASVVVVRDLFGSSIQCFALNLAGAHNRSTTITNITHNQDRILFDNLGTYSRQLADFVNVYCETKEYFSGNSLFSYRLFALLLGIQAAILYIPTLVWNITTARKIICNLRFISHDMEMLYKCLRGEWHLERGEYKQMELKAVLDKWSKSTSTGLYKKYRCKQISSFIFTATFFLFFMCYEFVNIAQIYGEFPCDVNEKFTVDCTVPSAPIYRFVWGSNMFLLAVNILLTLCNIVIRVVEPWFLAKPKNKPFAKFGVTLPKQPDNGYCTLPNDYHIMYAFFQANVENIDKLNYLEVLPTCGILVDVGNDGDEVPLAAEENETNV